FAAPSSSASADTSAKTVSEIAIRVASHIARRVRGSSAAHLFDHDTARPLLQHVRRDGPEAGLGRGSQIEVDNLRVASLRLLDDARADAARPDDGGADLQLLVPSPPACGFEYHLGRLLLGLEP